MACLVLGSGQRLAQGIPGGDHAGRCNALMCIPGRERGAGLVDVQHEVRPGVNDVIGLLVGLDECGIHGEAVR
ncbi:hypothetical protein D3C71_2064670 [compost metagenome]